MFGIQFLCAAVAAIPVRPADDMLDARPGGFISIPHGYDWSHIAVAKNRERGGWLNYGDCKGCGAPLPRIHETMQARAIVCEYCRREA
jgi:hypothetical protein